MAKDVAVFRIRTVNLAGNGEELLRASGERFEVLNATGPFRAAIEDQPYGDWQAGLEVGNVPGRDGRRESFQYLRFQDTSGLANVLTVAVIKGEFKDARLVVSGTVNTLEVKSAGVVDAPDVLLTGGVDAVVAANGTRRTVVLKALSTNAAPLRIGTPGTVAAGRGHELVPGEPISLDTAAAISAIGTAGDFVSILELRD